MTGRGPGSRRVANLSCLVEWAEAREDVRALLLVGSRADPAAPVDALSDHDAMLFVRDPAELASDDAWLEAFGSVLVMLRERYELLGQTVETRLVQYEDGTKIDFSLCPVDLVGAIHEAPEAPDVLRLGYRVLVDRDGLADRLPAPDPAAHVPRRPSEAEYEEVVNEFWWETLYVARHLARGEPLPARYSAECVLRFRCLVPMLEWHVQVGSGWSERLGPHGRGVAGRLGPEERALLERTYAGPDPDEGWDALFAATALFERAARGVAADLGFTYRDELGRKALDRLRRIRDGGSPAPDGDLKAEGRAEP